MSALAIAGHDRFTLTEFPDCERTALDVQAAWHDPFFKRAFSVWDSKRGTADAPFRRDIDAFDFPSDILPRLVLIEVLRGPLRFRFRLTGTKADQIHECNITGLYSDDLKPAMLAQSIRRDFTEIVESGRPQWVELLFTNCRGHRRRTRVLRLPLLANDSSSEDPRIGFIMSVFSFQKTAEIGA
ncbi:MAG: PAS domain-containing protein [Pseudomonadota bacterium]|nr:PAS domain-containing protein [Pseudomonadota bacterium]